MLITATRIGSQNTNRNETLTRNIWRRLMAENTEIVKVEAELPAGVVLTAEDWQIQNGEPFMKFLTGETTVYQPSPVRRTELDCVNGYRDEYLHMLFKHMEKGKSYESFGGKLGLTPGIKARFESNVMEWRLAKELGLLVCREYWEQLGIDIADGSKPQGNASVYNTTVQALFREVYGKQKDVRHEHNVAGHVSLQIVHKKSETRLLQDDEEYQEAEVKDVGAE